MFPNARQQMCVFPFPLTSEVQFGMVRAWCALVSRNVLGSPADLLPTAFLGVMTSGLPKGTRPVFFFRSPLPNGVVSSTIVAVERLRCQGVVPFRDAVIRRSFWHDENHCVDLSVDCA